MKKSTPLIASPKVQEITSVRIAEHRPIAKNQWAVWVKAEEGSLPSFLPGNFCMVSLPDHIDPLTPRPFAIVERHREMYLFIYRVTGKLTRMLTKMGVGSKLNLLGPLGLGIQEEHLRQGSHAFVAGGVGYASLLPLIETYSHQKPSDVPVYYGVREELEVIRRGSLPCQFASDDGSIGFNGRLPELIQKNKEKFDQAESIYVCGPTGMMKAVFSLFAPEKTFYFLEEAMGCGVGICMGCVVTIHDFESKTSSQTRRARSCIEGPIFRGDVLQYWKEQEHG